LYSIDNKLSEVVVTTVAVKKKIYQKQLDSTSLGKDVYARYLTIREGHLMEPVFHFDVANKLFAQGDTAKGLQVLSNVADLGYDDHELYKMLGYQLKTLRQYDEAVNTFRKVLQWRPQEPQSYRDYALALADAGKYQQALDTLYLALTKQYDETLSEMYHGIEEIIVTEINNLIAKHGQGLNTSRIDKKLLRNLPVDIRVVLNWNMNDSDIDLWVIDPKGERCYYSNKQTAVGGRISDDFTQGYGPEQFMLRKAPHGKYKVMMNYFSDSQQKIAGPVTVMAEIYTHYGKPNQQRKTVAFQMKNEGGEEGVLISEFIF
jgi:Ca-activated chloride channel homolog